LFIRSSHLAEAVDMEEAVDLEEAVMEADLRVEAVDGVVAADTVAVSGAAVGGKEVAEVSVCTFPYCLCSLACREYRGMFAVTGENDERFEVITAVTRRNTVSLNVTPCT
jgi:hypothetical protein